jgi:type IV secretion system protein VirB6
MMGCPALPVGADASLATTLTSLDCQVNGAVELGYGRLFGPHGVFGPALTALLTVYVAVLAIGLMTGHTRLTLGTLTPKALALGLILTFATAWPAYQTVVYGLLTGGPDEVASAFMGAHAGATQAFAGRLDRLFDAVVDLGRAVGSLPKAPNLDLAVDLIWTSALTLLLATLGLLIVARVVLAVLLALGPMFVILALFRGSRGLFEGWLRTAVAFALAPMLIVLGGSGLMAVLGPVIGAIADDPAGAVRDLRPIFTLFLAAMVYAGLTLALMWTAVSLTRGWRIGGHSDAAPAADPAAASASAAQARAFAYAADAAPGGERVASLVSAALRDPGASAAARLQVVARIDTPAAAPTHRPGADQRRAEGLGQSFRTPRQARTLAGPFGS